MGSPLIKAVSIAAETSEKSGGLPQFDTSSFPGQIFWLLLTFGIMYVLMSKIFLPKLGGIIEERRNRIADDYDQAAELKRQAEDAEKTYNQALADAKAKASSIAAQTRSQLDKEIAAMQAENEEKLTVQVAAAEQRIHAMKTQATAKVQEAAIDTTRALVDALIDEMPTAEAAKAAINAS